MNAPVLFEELSADKGQLLGVITLQSEHSLNSLTLEMVDLMLAQLTAWEHREDIACLLVKAAGDKAFCAGGDVHTLYQAVTVQPGEPCQYAEDFFAREYRLDYLLYNYAKPVICWGNGIVMGGGLGIMAACSHRVATEKTRVAMPEVTIALYPDVGGSWFLNRMPDKSGLFLALTGATINGADCVFTGLADYLISHNQFESILETLLAQPWSTTQQHNRDLVSDLLAVVTADCQDIMPAGRVEPHLETINRLCAGDDDLAIINAISGLETEDPWLKKAANKLASGSPLSARIIYRQLQISSDMALADIFRSELQLSTNMIRYPEFAEGIRASMIDKDHNPQWQFTRAEEVPGDLLDKFFTAPSCGASWPENPLADL